MEVVLYALLNVVSIYTFYSRGNTGNKLIAALSPVSVRDKNHIHLITYMQHFDQLTVSVGLQQSII